MARRNEGSEDKRRRVSVDGLTGFPEAISSVFPKTEIQRCIIHQIRNSTNYELDFFSEKWDKKYPKISEA